MKTKNSKGFSLLELMLVLGIIAALVVSAFIVYPKVQDSRKASTEANNISSLYAGVKSLYTGSSSYKGLDNTMAYKAKLFPDNLIVGNGTDFVHSYSGHVSVSSSSNTSSGQDDSGFTIKYTLLPSAACSRIVSAVGHNFYEINANGTTLEPSKMTTSDIVSACEARDENIGANGAYLIMYAE